MRLSSPDSRGFNPLPGSTLYVRFKIRLSGALCRETETDFDPDTGTNQGPARRAVRGDIHRGQQTAQQGSGLEEGSAIVEFTFLALLLMVPLVYFVITVSQIQGGSFAVVGAADQAAKVYIAQPDAATAQAAAERAVALALSDFGHQPDRASVTTSCNPADCQAAGSTVTVNVSLRVALPFMPFAEGLSATEVTASSTQLVGRYR